MSRYNAQQYRSTSFIRITMMPTLLLIVLGFTTTSASASQPNLPPGGNYTSIAAAPGGGFWIQRDSTEGQSGTVVIGGAPQYESVPGPGSIAAIPGRNAYWVVKTNGEIHARGTAPELCGGHLRNCSGFNTNSGKHITAAAAAPNGEGLWAVDSARHVWTAGNTTSYGDVTNDNRTPTGIAATPSGQGYYIVMNDGGVHARGDAVFYGSTGGNRPGGHDLVGIALSHDISGDVDGYWLVGSDGGVFTYGSAQFLGSSGGGPGRGAVSNIVSPDGRTYAWVSKEGQVSYSQAALPVMITSVAEGKVITVPNGSMEIVTPLQLAAANGSTSQKWEVVPANDKSVQLVNVNSGLCMDLESGLMSGRVLQYTCKTETQGQANQLWRPIKDISGSWQFQSIQQPEHRLYGYPEEYGSGLIVSFYTNGNLRWTVTPAP